LLETPAWRFPDGCGQVPGEIPGETSCLVGEKRNRLPNMIGSQDYLRHSDELRATARALARQLPYHIPLSPRAVQATSEHLEDVLETSAEFEQLLPGLIIQVALCTMDWKTPAELASSPFPAPARPQHLRGVA
jgi:hypothetical protein